MDIRTTETGHALIELALVLPLLMMISLVGIEFSRSLNFSQGAAALSRQIASRTFRDCISQFDADVGDNAERLAVAACLENNRNTIELFARTVFPGTEVMVSMYRYADPNPDCAAALNAEIVRVGATAQGARRYTSKIGFANPGASRGQELTGGLDKSTLCLSRAVVVGEVYIPYRSLSGEGSTLFSFGPEEFYSVAVM